MSNTVLSPFFDSGLFTLAESHLIATFSRLQPGVDPLELLALATASRAARAGHTCVDITQVARLAGSLRPDHINRDSLDALVWPDSEQWTAALANGALAAPPNAATTEPLRPLVLDGRRFYLQRYWVHEERVAHHLTERSKVAEPIEEDPHDRQQQAVATALGSRLSIITGGPGTGKTFTIARILIGAHLAAAANGSRARIALAAPTGKAAARITESIGAALSALGRQDGHPDAVSETLQALDSSATTVHRLLGYAPGDKFRHNLTNPLPHDMVIIDESSMISLSLMSRLLEAIRPDASLVLVGDPDQLSSIEVGTVLSDIIGPHEIDRPESQSPPNALKATITVLDRAHRFDSDSPIAALAAAVKSGHHRVVEDLLSGNSTADWNTSDADIELVSPHDEDALRVITDLVISSAATAAAAALRGDAPTALSQAHAVKVLAATRMHRLGLYHWSDVIEAEVGALLEIDTSGRWYVGRPVIITANDPVNRLANGDTGVAVSRDGKLCVALPGISEVRYLPPSRLAAAESWWATTIHKSQGSEFGHVVVSLPPAGSPALSRELLYTGITRATRKVTIIASTDSLREAISRPITRASGLRQKLWG